MKARAVKLACILCVALLLAAAAGSARAVPLPRPRSATPQAATEEAEPPEPSAPTACRMRLTSALAVAPSLPPITGPGECGAPDVVRLEAVVLPDQSLVAVTPPATLRCTMAEAIVSWVREEAAPRAVDLGSSLKTVVNLASYDCRGRNGIPGAKLSEHGKANALDIFALRLADGRNLQLADPKAPKDLREALRTSLCARFNTVLGPGSDSYHDNHVHVDLEERRGNYRICEWDVRDPASTPQLAGAGQETTAGTHAEPVPLPRERPITAH